MPRASRGELDARIDATEFARLYHDTKAFSPELARGLRRNLRDAGKIGMRAAQQQIRSAPTRGRQHTGLRQRIAAGMTVQVATSMRGRAGVFIRATTRRMPDWQKPMVRVYNQPRFRHPVFARTRLFGLRSVWVTQTGHPYFDRPIEGETRKMQDLVQRALDEAIDKIAQEGPTT